MMAPFVNDPSFFLSMASFDFDVDPLQSFTFDTVFPHEYVADPNVEAR